MPHVSKPIARIGLVHTSLTFSRLCTGVFPVSHYEVKFERTNRPSTRLTVQLTTKFTLACTIHVRMCSSILFERLVGACVSLHASHTSCAAATRESYFVQCTRVIHRVLHASQTWRDARESDLVRYTRVIVCNYVYYVRITPN